VYYQIGSKLNQRRRGSRYFQDPDFQKWLEVLTDATNPYYLKQTRSIIERLVADIASARIQRLRNIFLAACSLEYKFIEALISS
jgi:thiaminase